MDCWDRCILFPVKTFPVLTSLLNFSLLNLFLLSSSYSGPYPLHQAAHPQQLGARPEVDASAIDINARSQNSYLLPSQMEVFRKLVSSWSAAFWHALHVRIFQSAKLNDVSRRVNRQTAHQSRRFYRKYLFTPCYNLAPPIAAKYLLSFYNFIGLLIMSKLILCSGALDVGIRDSVAVHHTRTRSVCLSVCLSFCLSALRSHFLGQIRLIQLTVDVATSGANERGWTVDD